MNEENKEERYTHMDYRKAKVVHFITISREEEFIYKGKKITKEDADKLVDQYRNSKEYK